MTLAIKAAKLKPFFQTLDDRAVIKRIVLLGGEVAITFTLPADVKPPLGAASLDAENTFGCILGVPNET